jgi:hypothetical protein
VSPIFFFFLFSLLAAGWVAGGIVSEGGWLGVDCSAQWGEGGLINSMVERGFCWSGGDIIVLVISVFAAKQAQAAQEVGFCSGD